jgi:hypothetical protein
MEHHGGDDDDDDAGWVNIHQSSLAGLPIWEQVGGMDKGVKILCISISYPSTDL